MTKTLYLMRHGQTLFNAEKKIQGWCDSPLTDLGIKQAQAAGKILDDLGVTFDYCYSSTSERACDTLEIATQGKYPYERLKGLKEMNFGSFEAMDEFLHPPYPFGDYYAHFGGESETELSDRMEATLKKIMEPVDAKNVLAVSHGGAMANFVMTKVDSSQLAIEPKLPNCVILKLQYHDGKFTLVQLYAPKVD
ncbi:histidine phosphatase family protein [Lactobacillus equicursoris]|nr:histidine phosphatase family protein [Lactobacillus equicursoris]